MSIELVVPEKSEVWHEAIVKANFIDNSTNETVGIVYLGSFFNF